MKTETPILASAMDVLAVEIQSSDGVANAAIAEAAQRLRELEREAAKQSDRIGRLSTALQDAISTYDPNRAATLVTAERQEAWIAALNS